MCAAGSTVEFKNGVKVCIDFPDGSTPAVGDRVRVRIQKPFYFVPILKIAPITIRGTSTMRIERFAGAGTAPTTYSAGLAVWGVLMNRGLRNERGQVIVLAAVIIPVFLLMTALVLDAGSWFAHKRQLQNRADAAALAAGDELAKRWPACITDPTSQSVITDIAKHYGGAMESGGVADDPTAVNTEVVDNSKFDIAINSTSYDAGTDDSDGGGPCFDHAANPAPEGESNISPAGGTWVDVKVKEKDTKSFAGTFGVDLLQNRARARVELLESSQGDQFVPLAVPKRKSSRLGSASSTTATGASCRALR